LHWLHQAAGQQALAAPRRFRARCGKDRATFYAITLPELPVQVLPVLHIRLYGAIGLVLVGLGACGPTRVPLARTEDREGRRYVIGGREPFTGLLLVPRDSATGISVTMPYQNGVRDGQAEGRHRNEKPAFLETWKAGLREGTRDEWDSLGHRIRTQTFVNGKLEGKLQDFSPEGTLIVERPMKAGAEEGLLRTWYPSGKLKSEGEYRAGLLEGRMVIWYESGQKKYEGSFAAGKPNGVVMEYFEDGKPKALTTWDHGVADGPFTRWYANGQKQAEGRYKGLHPFDVKSWDMDGKPAKQPSAHGPIPSPQTPPAVGHPPV
jgi:antitoxin component YwqK of YwqJK toxin-antitoxin module